MKMNFYDELRALIKNELGITNEILREMILEQLNQAIASMVQREVQNIEGNKEKYFDEYLKGEILKQMKASSNWMYNSNIQESLAKVLARHFNVVVTVKEDPK